MNYKFKMNDEVYVDYYPLTGFGIIKGVATVELAVIGATYIVEFPTVCNDVYPFTHVAIPEIHLMHSDEVQ